MAREAGLSKDQQVQAVRVASVPESEFEDLIDSDTPPTVTKLAEQGKRTDLQPMDGADLRLTQSDNFKSGDAPTFDQRQAASLRNGVWSPALRMYTFVQQI